MDINGQHIKNLAMPQLSDTVIAALISGCITTIGFVITYYTTLRKKKLDQKRFERELARKYGERLYNIRLNQYGKTFQLIDSLGKTHGLQPFDVPGPYQQIIKI